jgi:hypothetical protein
MARPNKHDELRLLVNSRHPIITVETPEEERFEQMLLDVAMELGVPFYEWSVTAGLAKSHGAAIYNTEQPEQALANIPLIQGDAIFLLKDFGRYCDNDRICRRLRDLAEKFRTVRRAIVISAASMQLPAELAAEAAPFPLGLPTAEELLPGVKRVVAEISREQNIPCRWTMRESVRPRVTLRGFPRKRPCARCGCASLLVDARMLACWMTCWTPSVRH